MAMGLTQLRTPLAIPAAWLVSQNPCLMLLTTGSEGGAPLYPRELAHPRGWGGRAEVEVGQSQVMIPLLEGGG